MTDGALLKAARRAARRAHAPYSKFRVGAALLCADGSVVTGCNVENASYGLTICAERVAVVAAVAKGQKRFAAIAVVAFGKNSRNVRPCGACLQVLREFGAKIRVVCEDRSFAVDELLPQDFRL